MGRHTFTHRNTAQKAPAACTQLGFTLSYSGSAFRGLQVQSHSPTHHTVEGVVVQAAKDVGLLESIVKGVPGSAMHRLARACRTDKGVHAVRNIVTMFVENSRLAAFTSLSEVENRMNAHLPPGVRVEKILPLMGDFVPRNCCSRRVYRYMIPVYALLPPCDDWATMVKLYPDCIQTIAQSMKCPSDISASAPLFFNLTDSSPAESSGTSQSWIAVLNQAVSRCNHILQTSFVGSHRFHNFSVDPVNRGGVGFNAKAISPQSDQAVRTIRRCEVAPRVYLYPTSQIGSSETLRDYRENLSTLSRIPAETLGRPAPGALPESLQYLPFVVFQIEGLSFLLNMIRKIVGSMIAVCRGARAALIEEALSAEMLACTPLAPGPYLFLALSMYRGYDAIVASRRSERFKPVREEWAGAVDEASEEFAARVIAAEVVDVDVNVLPPLDDMLAVRDAARRVTRPQWETEEDTHLAGLKDYVPLVEGKTKLPACGEMTLFLRLLRVHNWSITHKPLPPDSKPMLEAKNKREKQQTRLIQQQQQQQTTDVSDAVAPSAMETDAVPTTSAAADSSVNAPPVSDGGEDGWIYVAEDREGELRLRREYFLQRWGKRSAKTWRDSGKELDNELTDGDDEELGHSSKRARVGDE